MTDLESGRQLRIQLWSYNYDPEPTGIGPISTVWAQLMQERGHSVEVVAAHPHYPQAFWGTRVKPYREIRDGIEVFRLPIWIGRSTARKRLRQELSFAGALTACLPALPKPDVVVAISPSFPALLPTMLNAELRRVPWILWLQDILPDGAVSTGVLRPDGPAIRAARSFERLAYRSADKIVALAPSFRDHIVSKGIPAEKVAHVYNPATRPLRSEPRPQEQIQPDRVLTMGNIGFSQGLEEIVQAFESSAALEELSTHFVLAGDGLAADDVRRAIRTDRVHVTGILSDDDLERELSKAAVAVVSQRYEGVEFNVPSKLMNFMAYGIPVVASVRPDSEVARILRESGGGWITDSRNPAECAETLADVLRRPEELAARGSSGLEFARRHFSPNGVVETFADLLLDVTSSGNQAHPRPTS